MSDTSREATRIQEAVQRRLTGVERLRIAMDMSGAVRTFARGRLRAQFPTWDERKIACEMLRLLGAELPPSLR